MRIGENCIPAEYLHYSLFRSIFSHNQGFLYSHFASSPHRLNPECIYRIKNLAYKFPIVQRLAVHGVTHSH